MHKKKAFMLIGAFWILIIGVFILQKEYTLRTGTEVILKCQPVDPRDLFRGDYVILSYDISRINFNQWGKSADLYKEGSIVYVGLDNTEEFAKIKQIYTTPPQSDLYIKGRVLSVSKYSMILEYGIESYFVPEGKGLKIERLRNNGQVSIMAVIDRDGHAVIKKLLVDGEGVRFE